MSDQDVNSMVCKAVAWSFIEEEKTERSANPFTLSVFDCLVLVVVTVEGGVRKIPFAIFWGWKPIGLEKVECFWCFPFAIKHCCCAI